MTFKNTSDISFSPHPLILVVETWKCFPPEEIYALFLLYLTYLEDWIRKKDFSHGCIEHRKIAG